MEESIIQARGLVIAAASILLILAIFTPLAANVFQSESQLDILEREIVDLINAPYDFASVEISYQVKEDEFLVFNGNPSEDSISYDILNSARKNLGFGGVCKGACFCTAQDSLGDLETEELNCKNVPLTNLYFYGKTASDEEINDEEVVAFPENVYNFYLEKFTYNDEVFVYISNRDEDTIPEIEKRKIICDGQSFCSLPTYCDETKTCESGDCQKVGEFYICTAGKGQSCETTPCGSGLECEKGICVDVNEAFTCKDTKDCGNQNGVKRYCYPEDNRCYLPSEFPCTDLADNCIGFGIDEAAHVCQENQCVHVSQVTNCQAYGCRGPFYCANSGRCLHEDTKLGTVESEDFCSSDEYLCGSNGGSCVKKIKGIQDIRAFTSKKITDTEIIWYPIPNEGGSCFGINAQKPAGPSALTVAEIVEKYETSPIFYINGENIGLESETEIDFERVQ